MALSLMLERTTLNNVDDAAGRWQYEGGTVFEEKRQVGYYASTKRVIFGATDAQNTAMLTLEVFFTPQMPPQNIVVQGSHDFNSGGEIGSVSAASAAYATYIGKEFHRVGNALDHRVTRYGGGFSTGPPARSGSELLLEHALFEVGFAVEEQRSSRCRGFRGSRR